MGKPTVETMGLNHGYRWDVYGFLKNDHQTKMGIQ